MRSYIAASVGREASAAFSAPCARRRWSSPASLADLAEARLERLEECDDGLRDLGS